MNPPRPRPGAPPVTATVHIGNLRADWCLTCKAWTKAMGDALLLSEDGVTILGTWMVCEICDDPTSREAPRVRHR
ncbi:hypothetical protein [Streptomyces sp. NPDC059063]|uniref:hypothetical protein n=1 Tax=Streptomyces sp. NPDC059063 TaxID=3346712 RepID=UPI0036A9FC61